MIKNVNVEGSRDFCNSAKQYVSRVNFALQHI